MNNFDAQPSLANATVRLSPIAPEDWSELYAVASDPEIWAGHPARDRWQEGPFRAFFEDALACGEAFTIRDAESGAVLGSSRYNFERCGPGEIEIGWSFLARSAWGGQVNGEVKRLLVGHALEHFERVLFLVGADNLRSRKALEKIGATLSDRMENASIGERVITHVVYMLDREQFRQGPLSNRGVEDGRRG
ncbi:MAG: GNAT family N-acetyltransferase [Candidatus Eremiobacteraeota bacterium]|nr:GNAT family N-acetyltransferase [Candidatus Eremiobacteraeota bacterium]